jgi:hypothetical protein
MPHQRLKKRYGHAKRKYGPRDASGRQRLLKGWVVYRGYTLDPYKGKKVAHSKATWEIRVHKGSGPGSMEGNTFGETLEEAMAKAKRLVDAMHGD